MSLVNRGYGLGGYEQKAYRQRRRRHGRCGVVGLYDDDEDFFNAGLLHHGSTEVWSQVRRGYGAHKAYYKPGRQQHNDDCSAMAAQNIGGYADALAMKAAQKLHGYGGGKKITLTHQNYRDEQQEECESDYGSSGEEESGDELLAHANTRGHPYGPVAQRKNHHMTGLL
ncbi:hypothetical protein BRADI_1g30690v3 [Brachypodium distachyon]|uniref:Uncharacterized protein n=1 Tax=Brachypodium distachyon TaxID=15368 RepID=I1GVH8_BRADI|nr:hypothetical protein BRADI_1g30690v3 [Brachypodium distachyon]